MAGRVCPAAQARTAGGVDYTLTRRRVRNLNLRVRADGSGGRVRPGAGCRWRRVDAFVAAHARVGGLRPSAARRPAGRPKPPRSCRLKAEALARMQALCAAYLPAVCGQLPGRAHCPASPCGT